MVSGGQHASNMVDGCYVEMLPRCSGRTTHGAERGETDVTDDGYEGGELWWLFCRQFEHSSSSMRRVGNWLIFIIQYWEIPRNQDQIADARGGLGSVDLLCLVVIKVKPFILLTERGGTDCWTSVSGLIWKTGNRSREAYVTENRLGK